MFALHVSVWVCGCVLLRVLGRSLAALAPQGPRDVHVRHQPGSPGGDGVSVAAVVVPFMRLVIVSMHACMGAPAPTSLIRSDRLVGASAWLYCCSGGGVLL